MVLVELLDELEYYAGEYPEASIWVDTGSPYLAQGINLIHCDDPRDGFELTIRSGDSDYECMSIDYLYDRCNNFILSLPESEGYREINVYDLDQGFFIGSPISLIVNERRNSFVGTWYEVVLKL